MHSTSGTTGSPRCWAAVLRVKKSESIHVWSKANRLAVGKLRGARSSYEAVSDSSATAYPVEGLGAADAIGSILKGISKVADCGILHI